MANSLTSQDLLKGVDFTILVNGNGTTLNQSIELSVPLKGATDLLGKGLVIVTKDTALDTPDIPDPFASDSYNKWQRYLWLRRSFDETVNKTPILYGYNTVALNPTLNDYWWPLGPDVDAINAAIAAAVTDAANALNTALAANATAAAAQTTANTANINATTAVTTANGATVVANGAQITAIAASTTAATASANATAANTTANAALTSATSALALATQLATPQHSVIYTKATSYVWVCPAAVTAATVECWGAGGGGGFAGGGGGSGQYSRKLLTVVPGTLYSVVVGLKGAAGINGGANGATGGSSTFNGTDVIAVGGGGAANFPATAGGIAGTGGTGDTQFNGYNGFPVVPLGATTGFGADSPSGGQGGNPNNTVAGFGAGGYTSNTGADGQVKITY